MNIIRETATRNTMIIKLYTAFWALNVLSVLTAFNGVPWLSWVFLIASWLAWFGQHYIEKKYEKQISTD